MVKSIYEEKIKSGDWHYDPMVNSTDYQYLGRIINLDCSNILSKIDFGKNQYCSNIEDKDLDSGINSLDAQVNDPTRVGYNKHNTKFQKIFPDTAPDYFFKVRDLCKLEKVNFNILRQPQGHMQPWHFDTFVERVKTYNLHESERTKFTRYLIMLEDWHWGHFLQIGNNVLSQWRSGDIITWNFGMYHLSANAGIKPKYTMLVTGMPNENSLCQKPNFKLAL